MKNPPYPLFEVLVAVAESKNLTEAAKTLNLSQPAISIKLQELERYCPTPVFGIEGRRKVLTHYGQALYKIARQHKKAFVLALENVNRNYATADQLVLRVACRKELFDHLLHYFLFPGQVELELASSQQAVDLLMDREVDIAISYLRPDSLHIFAKKIFESNCKFVIHRKLLGKQKLDLQTLRNKDFLTRTPAILYQKEGLVLVDWLKHQALNLSQLKISAIAPGWGTIQSMVNQNFGYSIVPDYLQFSKNLIEELEIPTSIIPTFEFFALFHKELREIQAFQRLLEFKK